jgi:hypothetical protein
LETLIKFIRELDKEREEEIWRKLGKLQWREGRNWIRDNLHRLGVKGDDAVTGAEIVRVGLQTVAPGLYSKKEYKIKEESPEKVVVEVSGWCPILEACKKMRINPEKPIEYIVRQKIIGMLQTVNPKLDMYYQNIDLHTMKREIVIYIKE